MANRGGETDRENEILAKTSSLSRFGHIFLTVTHQGSNYEDQKFVQISG